MAADPQNQIGVVTRRRDVLGEGPVYLADRSLFCWINFGTNWWCGMELSTRKVQETQFETALTGFAPSGDGGYLAEFAYLECPELEPQGT